jgi:hypothetical protein
MVMVVVIVIPHNTRENTNVAHYPKKMSTLGRCMLRYLQGKTADAIASLLGVVFMLHQQTRVLLIHKL